MGERPDRSGVVRTPVGPPTLGGYGYMAISGENMPTHNLPGWRLVFTDDFQIDVATGGFPTPGWKVYQDGWFDTSRRGRHAPSEVISVHDDVLDKWLRTVDGTHLVAAIIPNLPPMLYGRYAVRFRADVIVGYKIAWLLWPDSNIWPRDGEIDHPEGDLDKHINAYMHRQKGTSPIDQAAFTTAKLFGPSWYTCVIEWSPGHVQFFINGNKIGAGQLRVPNTPMHWVLQSETRMAPGLPPADDVSGHILIDWVAAWSFDPSAT